MPRPTAVRLARRIPPVVLAAALSLGALAAAWSVVLPPAEAPDEPSHLGLVLHLADGGDYPDPDGLRRTRSLVRLCETFAASVRVCPLPGEAVSVDAVRRRGSSGAPDRSVRPAWDDDGGDAPTAALNQMPQHPPLYYGGAALVLRAVRGVAGGTMAIDRELALLRLANCLLVVPLPVLAWATGRRLALGRAAAEGAALAVAAVPMLAATAGTVNNDNLLTLVGAVTAYLLARVATGDLSRRTLLGTGVAVAVGLLTKAFAVVFVPAAAVAVLVGARGARRKAGAVVVAGGLVALPMAAVAGPWFVRSWVRTGSLTPSADADRYTAALRPPGFEADPVAFADRFAGLLFERFWGSFGWYSVRLPGLVVVTATLVALAVVATGLVTGAAGAPGERQPGGTGTRRRLADAVTRRAPLLVVLAPVVLLVALTAGRAWSLHARSGQYPFIQGRYLFAGLVGPAVLAGVGWVRLVGSRGSTAALAAVVAGFQLGSLAAAAAGFWEGSPPVGPLESIGAWSALPGWSAWALVAGGVTVTAVVPVVALHGGRAGPPPPVRSAGP